MTVVVKIAVGAIVLLVLLYVGSCTLVSNQRERAFDQVKEGDSEAQVIAVMGQPVDREIAGHIRLAKYGMSECKAPCVQRIWYLNKFSIAGEAWAIELGTDRRVVHTAHIVSP